MLVLELHQQCPRFVCVCACVCGVCVVCVCVVCLCVVCVVLNSCMLLCRYLSVFP